MDEGFHPGFSLTPPGYTPQPRIAGSLDSRPAPHSTGAQTGSLIAHVPSVGSRPGRLENSSSMHPQQAKPGRQEGTHKITHYMYFFPQLVPLAINLHMVGH